MRLSLLALLLGLGSLVASCDGTPPQPDGQVENPSEESPEAFGGAEQDPLPDTQPNVESPENSIDPQSTSPDAESDALGGAEAPALQPGQAPPSEEGLDPQSSVEPQGNEELPLVTELEPSREAPAE